MLKITPQINEGSGVKLKIEQETSSISARRLRRRDLVTNNRTITTSVFVEDGGIVVLGGLIDDRCATASSACRSRPHSGPRLAVPRAQDASTPRPTSWSSSGRTILRDERDARFQTDAKYNYMQDLQQQDGRRATCR